jgi:hypothetical protein
MKALYTSLRTKIETIDSIKWCRLFNDQFNKSNNDNVDQNIEQGFPYPCVFIEFPEDNEQISAGAGAKQLDVLIRIHIGFLSYKLEDITVFDIAAEVQEALEGFSDTLVKPLTYEAQRMDYDHNNVYVYQFDFRTTYTDNTKYFKRNAIAAPDPLTVEINAGLDIDNIVIRTGDGA